MRKTKEILRLKSETDLTNRQIARSLNVSPTTVAECLKRAREAGLVWPFDTNSRKSYEMAHRPPDARASVLVRCTSRKEDHGGASGARETSVSNNHVHPLLVSQDFGG